MLRDDFRDLGNQVLLWHGFELSRYPFGFLQCVAKVFPERGFDGTEADEASVGTLIKVVAGGTSVEYRRGAFVIIGQHWQVLPGQDRFGYADIEIDTALAAVSRVQCRQHRDTGLHRGCVIRDGRVTDNGSLRGAANDRL